jgi:CheY-like chemotaxis protein
MNTLKKVLVVDDDPVVRLSFDRVLTPKGYAVIAASNGPEALERIENEDYDMVYTDIRMPGMDGIEVARNIRASRPWLPVLIITGYGDRDNEAAAAAAGVARFLHKPLSPDTIEESARSAAAAATVAMLAPPAALAPAPAPASFWTNVRNVGLFLAAPWVALFYVLVGPFVLLGMLGWVLLRAILGLEKAQER